MRVGFFVPFFPQLSETFVIEQAGKLAASGHDLKIFCLSGGSRSLKHPALEAHDLIGRTRTLMGPHKHGRDKVVRAARRTLRQLPRSGRVLARLIRQDAGRGMKVPVWASAMAVLAGPSAPWRFDIMQVHYGPMGLVVDALRELGLVEGPMVVTFHGSDVSVAVRDAPQHYQGLFQRAERLTANSTFLRDRLLALGAPPDRTLRLPVGVELSTIRPREAAPGSQARLITVGRLAEEKGLEVALRALSLLRYRGADFRYTIIGDGPRRKALTQLVSELDLEDRVELAGARPHARVLTALAEHDIFVMPGIEAATGSVEAQGRALVEAQAARLPVVASAIGGIPETVGAGGGLLVPPGDPGALADALSSLIRSPGRWPDMGSRGRAHVEAGFDQREIHARLEALYHALAGSATSGEAG